MEGECLAERFAKHAARNKICAWGVFFGRGRSVGRDDFDLHELDNPGHDFLMEGKRVAGWITLNDGGQHGEQKIPYWSTITLAEKAAREVALQYERAGLDPPRTRVVGHLDADPFSSL